MANQYYFGADRTSKTGFYFDKALQQKKCSLVALFRQEANSVALGKYGPQVSQDFLLQEQSEGDESEVEITDLQVANTSATDTQSFVRDNGSGLRQKIKESGKGGPRIHHVTQQILELSWLTFSVSCFRQAHFYLVLRGRSSW